jgi:hypothetical protein
LKKSLLKKFENITNCRRGGREGGWRIVIPMPEAINFVDGRRQKTEEYRKVENFEAHLRIIP